MSQICSVKSCYRFSFSDYDECVLHCEKGSYSKYTHDKSILREFNNALIDYIVDSFLESALIEDRDIVNEDSLKHYLQGKGGVNSLTVEFVKNQIVHFDQIFFPGRDNRDRFDYLKVLKKITYLHFDNCRFCASSLDISESKVFYQDCEFLQRWGVYDSIVLDDVADDGIFQQCIFRKNVDCSIDSESTPQLFRNCRFEQSLCFESSRFASSIFNNSSNEVSKIQQLIIRNCKIENKFILNNLETDYLLIEDSEFKSKVELKECSINKFELTNSNIDGLFDCYQSRFGRFKFFKAIFSDFVGFEQCRFADTTAVGGDLGGVAVFKYVTFLSFTNFRSAVFNEGLDLESVNLKDAPNFLGLTLCTKNTNRETLRIIKNSFDNIGNHIDANQFFVMEMKKYKEELKESSSKQEKLVFWLNEKVSDFGQNYVSPIVLIAAFSVLFQLILYGYEANYLYTSSPSPWNSVVSSIAEFLNTIASNFIPFSKFLKEGVEFISLIFYLVFASLTWQAIVAIKRHTKR